MKPEQLKNRELEKACKEYNVTALYVFGSAVSGRLSENSDLDFLVEFYRTGYEGAFDQFMGFKERLEEIYQRPVDLVHIGKFRNPIFQQEADQSKVLLYAA
jgi:hypothetical protein